MTTAQQPQSPTVLLVGGAPGTGKTTLARAVAAELGWRWLPGDALATAMRGVTEAATHPALHVVAPGGHIEYFTDGPPERLVEDARQLQAAAWPGFERVIRFHARFGPPATIDSWTFTPAHVAGLDAPEVVAAWIVIDPDVLYERERRQAESDGASAGSEQRFANFMHRSLWCNDTMEREARRHGMTILHQDGNTSVDDHAGQLIQRSGLRPVR